MQRLPIEAQTVYAELVEQLTALETLRSLGSTPGTFVTKSVKGADYFYYQYVDVAGRRQQKYVGRRSDQFDRLVERFSERRLDAEADLESVRRLGSSLAALGVALTDSRSARVIRALADAGLFRAGAVLVGTHAFTAIGNMLGVSWIAAGMRTQDIDLAALRVLEVATPTLTTDLPGVVDSLNMGFLPVPGLDPRLPSTSFKVRGEALRIDLLTPAPPRARGPVTIRRFRAAAQPLRFLDYVVESTSQAAIINGEPVLVSVPDPARFALHKLITASVRPAVETAKQNKDRLQASMVLEVLFEDRPGDVESACRVLGTRGSGWVKRVRGQLKYLPHETAQRVEQCLMEAQADN